MIEPIYQPAASRYEDGMTYRRAGRSGVLLPAFSLGMWHNFGSGQTFSNVRQMAHYAFDRGIVHFDLANNYGPAYGTAEENFGRLMEQSFRPYRDELFISTKAGYDMWPGPYGNWGSRKYLMASLDQSLRRMKLDYVDIFYSHRYDPETPLEETLQALVDIVRAGKALYVGLSRYPLAAARFALPAFPGSLQPVRPRTRHVGHPDAQCRGRGWVRGLFAAGTGAADRPLPERYSGRLAHGGGGFAAARRADGEDVGTNPRPA